jgi:hypothetical protein
MARCDALTAGLVVARPQTLALSIVSNWFWLIMLCIPGYMVHRRARER